MSLRIQIEDGTGDPQELQFDDTVDEVVIGRNAERCHVVLPAELTVVGREHLALRRQLGRYRLVLNGSNPVTVEGRPAIDGMELPMDAEIQLGKGGPILQIETLLPASLPETQVGGAVLAQTPESILREARRRSRANRRLSVGVAVLMLAIAAVGVYAFLQAQKRSKEQVEDEFKDIASRIEALKESQSSARREAVRAIESRLTDVESLRPDLRGLRNAMAGVGPALEGLEFRMEQMRPRIHEHIRTAEKSVYLVLTRSKEGDEEPVATAWVAAFGRLATNAHVAEGFRKLKPGQKLIVRSPGATPHDHEVKSVELHPGYQAFAELWKGHAPTRIKLGRKLERLNEVPSCDVAILDVGNAENLDAPLPIAPPERLAALGPGDVVGFVGYPLEDMAGGAVNMRAPSPSSHVGHITSVTNFFLGRTTPAESHLVQHNMTTVGGTSGSPVIDSQGQVIAIHNAGNFVFVGGKRVPSADVNFAQRADLLTELLEGRAAEEQATRSEGWRAGIATFQSLKSAAEKAALDYLREQLALKERELGVKAVEIHHETAVLESSPGAPTRLIMPFELPSAGLYVVYAWSSTGEDINLALLHPEEDRVLVADRYPDYFPIVSVPVSGPQPIRILIDEGSNVAHGEFSLKILHFPPPSAERIETDAK